MLCFPCAAVICTGSAGKAAAASGFCAGGYGMTDLERMRQIEERLGYRLEQVPLERFHEKEWWGFPLRDLSLFEIQNSDLTSFPDCKY